MTRLSSSKAKISAVVMIPNLDSLPSKAESDMWWAIVDNREGRRCRGASSLYKDMTWAGEARDSAFLISNNSDAGGLQTTCLSRSPSQATKAINSRTALDEGENGLIRLTSWVYGHQHQT